MGGAIMPYIKMDARVQFDEVLDKLDRINTKGELEYCIYSLMLLYMKDKEPRYSNLHDTVYAAQHCADEFRRRLLDKREDQAIQENGDI
jgi:hypothetical protein